MSKIYIAVIGVGGVGKAFVKQLANFNASRNDPQKLTPILISRSSSALISKDYSPIDLSSWSEDIISKGLKPLSFPDDVISFLAAAPGHTILVDNTSDGKLASSYPIILKKGINIVTPNKKGFSSDISLWHDIFRSAYPENPQGGMVLHEATVGAGLPVLSTVKELLETGDKVKMIEGVFSGTMSYLFNTWAPAALSGESAAFSNVVKTARDLGYTEPDPRDDLNGLDVARKVTILARLSGLQVASPTSFKIQSLIPGPLETVSTADEFLTRLPEFDKDMDQIRENAQKANKVIRYVGRLNVDSGEVYVGLDSFNQSHPIAGLKGSDNIINFYTERYGNNPLVIQGAGAGAEVTAMGVLGDVIKMHKILQRMN